MNSLVGNTYGDYTVLNAEIQRRKSGAIQFPVQCKCGKKTFCTKQELTTGKRNRCDSCGKKKRFGERIDNISINFFHNYKRSAQRRNIDFTINLEYVADLFKKQGGKCAVSGIDIEIGGTPWKGQTGSLDRIDPTKGYIEGNVQWVHKLVNELKWDLQPKEFFTIIKQIYEYKKLEEYEAT